MTGTTVITPDFTDTVKQSFFIEPLGGAKHPVSYLDRFPDALYTKAIDSNFVNLMYTLLGPAGVGSVQAGYLEERLAIEAGTLDSSRLEALYSNPLAFARLIDEQNDIDISGLVSPEDQAKIQEQDASFRNRVIDFLHAVRAGGTPLGLTLAAKSGLGYPVEVVENYKALYDNFSDAPLGLTQYGVTQSTEEVVVIPRPSESQSSVQTLTFSNVQGGNFLLFYPVGTAPTANSLPLAGPLAYNDDYDDIQTALQTIPALANNVIVTGGPLPDNDIIITFVNQLANQPVPTIQVIWEDVTGITDGIIGFIGLSSGTGATPSAAITETQAGVSADSQVVTIDPQSLYYMTRAMNDIKPMTTIITTALGQGNTLRKPANTISSNQELTSVVRYAIGAPNIPWPPLDSVHWIESSLEHQAPRLDNVIKGNYQGFHNITNIQAYTEQALLDPLYNSITNATDNNGNPLWSAVFNNQHLGIFSGLQQAIYPFLASFVDPKAIFSANLAQAFRTEPLTVTGHTPVSREGIINDIYPSSYQGLPGVTQQPNQSFFWSSLERAEGADILEIDLGSVQAVNYIYFEATNKPYSISVSYDLLDQAPNRIFVPVTLENPVLARSNTSLVYTAPNTNPWSVVNLHFTNALGQLIFTRFIRLEFTKNPGVNSPFVDAFMNLLPYSIEVQNLRVGRNIG